MFNPRCRDSFSLSRSFVRPKESRNITMLSSAVQAKRALEERKIKQDIGLSLKRNQPEAAVKNFELLKEKGFKRSTKIFNLFLEYSTNMRSQKQVLEWLGNLRKEEQPPDIVTFNIILEYVGSKDINKMDEVLKEMRFQKTKPNVGTYRTIDTILRSKEPENKPLRNYYEQEKKKDQVVLR